MLTQANEVSAKMGTFVWQVFEGIWQEALIKAWHAIPLDNVAESLACTQCAYAL